MFTASSSIVILPSCPPPNRSHFNEVLKNEVLRIINNSSAVIMSFRFLLTDCVHIFLPSMTKLANVSLAEGAFPQKFKKVVLPSKSFEDLSTGVRGMFHVKIGGADSCVTVHATCQQ